MRSGGRKLTPEEEALWARVAQTVTPIAPAQKGAATRANAPSHTTPVPQPMARPSQRARPVRGRVAPPSPPPPPVSAPPRPLDARGLDASWDRRLSRGVVAPDFTLDLHGCTLDAAHSRLLHGLTQAKAMGARVVLLVTGKPRPADAADRGSKRGAIRAKVIDWLAHSEHAHDIAAVRGAHRRHGGQGALYIILRKRRF